MKSVQVINLELLSPARNAEFGKAAINHGADAIYIGAPMFGARAAASNSIQEIEKLLQYAHLFRVKVYATINTVLFDRELNEVSKIIHSLYNAGIDGLIIQDMGILEMDLPPVPLIASTQTHNNCLEKVEFFESLGFKRVILARELSINQIKDIKSKTKIELEFFVHGALCVSYSGQCYMSEAICNRSGNRGVCAQPCRSVYDLLDKNGKQLIKDKHLLSLHDLNLSKYLTNLIDAGITSFKIEGRLKDISYVKNITSFYRQQLDAIIEGRDGFKKASSGIIYHNFNPDPEKSFNRGFTSYFINDRKDKTGSPHTQKSLGKRLGHITSVNKSWITTDCNSLVNGDGLCFFDNNNVLHGTSVQKVEGERVYLKEINALKVGTRLFRNHDQKFEKLLSAECATRKIGVNFILKDDTNGLKLIAGDEDNFESEITINTEKEIAKNTESAGNIIINQLSRLGDTIFEAREIKIETAAIYFLAISVINNARRKVIVQLHDIRLNNYHSEKKYLLENFDFKTPLHLSYLSNVSNKLAQNFYNKLGTETIEPAFELIKVRNDKQVMITKHCIKYQFDACPVHQNNKNLWIEPLYLKDNHHIYRLEFDCKNCEMKVIFEK